MEMIDSFLKRAIAVTGGLLLIVSIVFATYYYLTFLAPRDSGRAPEAKMGQLEKEVLENPKDPNLRASVAATYLQQGYYDAAVTQAETALSLAPQHQGAMLVLAEAWLKREDEEKASAVFQRLVDANRDSPTAKSNRYLGAAYYNLGRIQARRGSLGQAIASFQSALEVDRTDADAHVGLGRAHESSGHHDDAVSEFKAATRFVPDFKDAYEGLLACYQLAGRPEEIFFARGMVAYSAGEYADAVKSLSDATTRAPRWADAHLGLGLALEQLGRGGEAMIEYQTALSIDSTNLTARVSADRLGKRQQSGVAGT